MDIENSLPLSSTEIDLMPGDVVFAEEEEHNDAADTSMNLLDESAPLSMNDAPQTMNTTTTITPTPRAAEEFDEDEDEDEISFKPKVPAATTNTTTTSANIPSAPATPSSIYKKILNFVSSPITNMAEGIVKKTSTAPTSPSRFNNASPRRVQSLTLFTDNDDAIDRSAIPKQLSESDLGQYTDTPTTPSKEDQDQQQSPAPKEFGTPKKVASPKLHATQADDEPTTTNVLDSAASKLAAATATLPTQDSAVDIHLAVPRPSSSNSSNLPPMVPQTPLQQSRSKSQLFSEFDPFVPTPNSGTKDSWIMSFESPAVNNKSNPSLPSSQQQQQQLSALQDQKEHVPVIMSAPRTPVNVHMVNTTSAPVTASMTTTSVTRSLSLLDIANEVATPRSVPKFSERDMSEQMEKYNQTLEDERKKYKTLETKHAKALEQHKQIQVVLDEYEKTMAKMIDDARVEREKSKIQIDKLLDERKRLQMQVDAVELSFKELRLRYEDGKSALEASRKSEEALKLANSSLQKDLLLSQERYTKVVQHAEEKIQAANVEISKVRSNYEKDMSATKAKFTRAEMQIKTLEKAMEMKQSENKQLTELCDELLGQLEGAK